MQFQTTITGYTNGETETDVLVEFDYTRGHDATRDDPAVDAEVNITAVYEQLRVGLGASLGRDIIATLSDETLDRLTDEAWEEVARLAECEDAGREDAEERRREWEADIYREKL